MDDGPRIIHDASVVRGIVVTKDELQPPLENAAGGRPALNGDRCPRRQATKHGKVERLAVRRIALELPTGERLGGVSEVLDDYPLRVAATAQLGDLDVRPLRPGRGNGCQRQCDGDSRNKG